MLGNGVVGILREECNKWERRAPLAPLHCGRLLRSGAATKIVVQPCNKRIFRDMEYADVGCLISDDLSQCGLVLGVKQPKLGSLLENRAYGFFSHTHKARQQNLPLLDEVLEKRVLLYDYELIADEKGRRLVAFGEYAGRAGLIDFLRGLGERLLSLGYSTPFLSLGSAYMYTSLSAAKSAVIAVGDMISSSGLPSEICPLIFVFTGSGNVSRGAQEIIKLLPHEYIEPSNLKDLVKKKPNNHKVYACVVTAQHMVAPNDPTKEFDKMDYYSHPQKYHPIFHKEIAPYASVIVNCMYWEHRYPPLLTNEQLHDMFTTQLPQPRLLGISDISCDISGSIECLNRTTPIEKPFFRYNPASGTYHEDLDGDGIFFLAVDILPTEFAREATKHFGNVLYPFLSAMVRSLSFHAAPMPLTKACIACNGRLSPRYEYIERMRESEPSQSCSGQSLYRTTVSLSGRKFLVNEALDIIEKAGGQFRVGQTPDALSFAEIEVTAESEEVLANITNTLSSMEEQSTEAISPAWAGDKDPSSVSILILGAGRMCHPAVSYLAGKVLDFSVDDDGDDDGDKLSKKIIIYVGSLFLQDALEITSGVPNTVPIQVDVSDPKTLRKCVSEADVVVSLLPPYCHESVAVACIDLKKHLVTASYVSDSMWSLSARAQEAGVTLLCEMGLDPGIDHMMAMKMIDDAHNNGGIVASFLSYCGGLPAPIDANNPLGYKFSWNPAGAIKAGRNQAIYKENKDIKIVPGEKLFSSAVPFSIVHLPALALERLPNRDSLIYGDVYKISQEAKTIFRATLRYQGFSEIMSALGSLGYYNTGPHPLLVEGKKTTYSGLFRDLLASSDGLDLGKRTKKCIRFLELDSDELVPGSCTSPFDVMCKQMEAKLVFKPGEQDMVLLHHELEITYDSRPAERHSATLLTLGEVDNDKPQTAMARTVGLTAAIGAELLLTGKVKSRGVLRPLDREIYAPALEILGSLGLKLEETLEPLV